MNDINKELRKTKGEFDVALSKALESSEKVYELLERREELYQDMSYEERSVADFDVSEDGNWNIA